MYLLREIMDWILQLGSTSCLLDADDWVEPEMIESLHELILKHQAGVSACRYVESHQTEFLSRDEKKDGQVTIAEGQVEAGIQLLLPGLYIVNYIEQIYYIIFD